MANLLGTKPAVEVPPIGASGAAGAVMAGTFAARIAMPTSGYNNPPGAFHGAPIARLNPNRTVST
jgi:hypothetical protein